MKQLKKEEVIAKKYLDGLSIGDVTPQSDDPPDLILASRVGVEVRRLNENYFGSGRTKGLEEVDVRLNDKLKEVLGSYGNRFDGHTYFVGLNFGRPLGGSIANVGDEIRKVLDAFLKGTRTTPSELRVNENILLYIFPASPHANCVFRYAGTSDDDSGGVEVQLYAKNISHCIEEKSHKIASRRARYNEWWLLLVDTIGAWSLQPNEVQQIRDGISSIGNFNRLIVINHLGDKCLLEMP
jgi:hypothetical protein